MFVFFQTYGMIRVPLFSVFGTDKGLPTFLCNGFAGNAKLQLMHTIQKHDIMPREELDHLMNMYVALRKKIRENDRKEASEDSNENHVTNSHG